MKNEGLARLLTRVAARPRLVRALHILNRLICVYSALALALGLYLSYLSGWRRALAMLVSVLVPFLLVTALRAVVRAPRPAELYGLPSLPGRRLRSFPSRHVHSALSIGAALTFVSPPLGISVAVLGICLGACRVLLGYHFPRDVIAGALTGSIGAILGMIIL